MLRLFNSFLTETNKATRKTDRQEDEKQTDRKMNSWPIPITAQFMVMAWRVS